MIDIREQLARGLLGADYASLTDQRKSVIDLIADQRPTGIAPTLSDDRSRWDKLADSVARVGGSWSFILAFCCVLLLWIASNLWLAVFGRAFDPYPFIFLNLILSMVAALQAPVIMMSQNRQAAKDRAAAEHDYLVNLRAELEIMRLHEKVDALRMHELNERLDITTACLEELRRDIAALRDRGG
jgi:uncharacterized membrane protein